MAAPVVVGNPVPTVLTPRKVFVPAPLERYSCPPKIATCLLFVESDDTTVPGVPTVPSGVNITPVFAPAAQMPVPPSLVADLMAPALKDVVVVEVSTCFALF